MPKECTAMSDLDTLNGRMAESAIRATDIGSQHTSANSSEGPTLPWYLSKFYWWAYLHPRAVRFFDRPWMINLILLGNYRFLGNAAIASLGITADQRILQIACVYGDLTPRIASGLEGSASLDVVDVAQIQLDNLRPKVASHRNVRLHRGDSTSLKFADGKFDKTLLFFLLHEQPEDARRATLAEALRVTRPGGRVIIVDYHGPSGINPVRYFMAVVLKLLEPFAMDLWRKAISDFLPCASKSLPISKHTFFGGLYQVLSIKT